MESRSFSIVHCSVTGTAEDTAHRIAKRAKLNDWNPTIKSIQQFNPQELMETDLVVFVIPTTGNGVAPPSFIPFWTALLHPSLPNDLLSDLKFTVFALGDSSYPKYNWAGRKLWRRMEALGAVAVGERGEGDEQNEWGIESTFPKWLDSFFESIEDLAPSSGGSVPKLITPDRIPPPRIHLSPLLSSNGSSATKSKLDPVNWAPDIRWATIKTIERVTKEDWFQDVRSIDLAFEEDNVEYPLGSVLEIKPQNDPKEVDEFLTAVGWLPLADTPYLVTASDPHVPLPPHFPNPCVTTIRNLLTNELDFGGVPRISFLEWLGDFCKKDEGAGEDDPDLGEKLKYFCSGAGQDELNDYTHRPRRTMLEVLHEFKKDAKVPIEYVMDLLPPMRSRGFSVASSCAAHPGEVHLLAAIIKYRTILSVPRKGVCTSYLTTLSAGDRIPVRFEKGELVLPPLNTKSIENPHPPLIMIGPGTGVVPFRALMEERKRVGARDNVLFFGCRSVEVDFFWKEEWEEMVDQGWLKLFVAPSRDQEDKIYVQHRIAEQADLMWDFVDRGGYIYLCGSSKAMPKSVKKAFVKIFDEKLSPPSESLEEAGVAKRGEKLWDEMEVQKRIVEETWG